MTSKHRRQLILLTGAILISVSLIAVVACAYKLNEPRDPDPERRPKIVEVTVTPASGCASVTTVNIVTLYSETGTGGVSCPAPKR